MGDIRKTRMVENQEVVSILNMDLNGWDCNGNNVSSGLCSSSVIEYLESLGKKVIIDGKNVTVVDKEKL